MDEYEADAPTSFNAITCSAWVPRGIAGRFPAKIEFTKEELKEIISKKTCKSKDVKDKENADGENSGYKSKIGGKRKDNNEEDDKIVKKYGLDDGDNDDEAEEADPMVGHELAEHLVYASVDEDPYVDKEEWYTDSEDENNEILPSDNLLLLGHIEGEVPIMEAYVYNSERGNLYVHHDFLLPSIPLCIEWLNYDSKEKSVANLVAVGTMSPMIEVWDIDILDSLHPIFTLGSKGKKKKKLERIGHKEPVLSLAWNSYLDHLLASGSVDKTVILWDLETRTVGQHISEFSDKVQALQWNPTEHNYLLTGSADKKVKVFDCRAEEGLKSWELDGDVESIAWDKMNSQPFNFLASTDQGSVYYMDVRKDKPLWTVQSHESSCTAICMSSSCPGLLMTASEDKFSKVWDIHEGKPKLIDTINPKVGIIYTLTACPNEPFVFCFGGDNRDNNMDVKDIRHSKAVRLAFCDRLGLPLDVDEDCTGEKAHDEEMDVDHAMSGIQEISLREQLSEVSDQAVSLPPKKAHRKKKGGHLDKRKR